MVLCGHILDLKGRKRMLEKIIPVVFKELLRPPVSIGDIENYGELSRGDVISCVFDELLEENAHQLFTGYAGHIHESSHRDAYYYTRITCNFLHLAVRLQRSDLVIKLLDEYHVNPRQNLQYIQGKEEESYDLPSREKVIDDESFSITTLELAQKTGNTQIVDLINTAMNSSAQHEQGKDKDDGYIADVESEKIQTAKPIHYKKRLILGDGNFSYSRALSKKQQEKGLEHFPEALTVTEYANQETLTNTYSSTETEVDFKNFNANLCALLAQGAKAIGDVDATKIDQAFRDKRFKRIHFNFPYYNDNKSSPAQKKAKTRELVGNFFESAAKIQEPGDRIHMALVTGFRDPVWYENATYGVGDFCERHGYVYIKKHGFIDGTKKRYPGYFHVKTASNTSVETAEKGREFIFEKRMPGKDYQASSEIKKTNRGVSERILRAIETDSDSSSYVEHSDEEQTTGNNTLGFLAL